MLDFLSSRRSRFSCSGLSRRDFLRAGALGFGGLTCADLFRLRAESDPARPANKAVISIYLAGGPSQL